MRREEEAHRLRRKRLGKYRDDESQARKSKDWKYEDEDDGKLVGIHQILPYSVLEHIQDSHPVNLG